MTTKNFRVRNGLSIGGATSGSTSLEVGATGTDINLTLPTAYAASNGYVLASTTAGVLSWVDNSAAGTTYTIDASVATGGANLNLQGSDSTTDTIKFANGTNVTITATDANTITIDAPDTNTTYDIEAVVAVGGADLRLTGSDSSVDSVKFAGGTNVTITATDANTITIDAPDTNTTYDFNATTATGGANFNLVGSDATTDTVKLSNGGHITAAYTSATEVTLGSDATDANTASTIVARNASGDFSASGATLGNITVGVATDQTITTTTGNLVLDSTSGTITMNSAGTLGFTLNPITGFNPNADFTGNIVKGVIRTGAGEVNGNVFQGLAGALPSVGVSIDNTDKPTARTGLVMRNYGGSLSGGLPRNTTVWEAARGTAATPLNIGTNDSLGEIMGTGYTSTGWIADQGTNLTTGIIRLRASENWNNGLNNVGTQLLVLTQPTATALTASSVVATLINSPASTTIQSNSVNINQGSNSPTGGSVLNIGGPGTTGGSYLSVGDVNIAQMSSSWQSVFSPGFKYNGLGSSTSANITGNGTLFEMSPRWKASAGSSTFVPPQNNWGLGAFQFSADKSTTNTSQQLGGQIRVVATENWDATHYGTKITLDANRLGNGGGLQVASLSPETATFTSEVVNVHNTKNSGTPYGDGSNLRFNAGDPAGATFNDRTSQLRVSTASTSAGDASTIVFNTNNFNVGTNTYSPSVAGDTLGEFFFSGNYASGGGAATLGPSVRFAAQAAETFTGTNSGGRFVISVDKIGGNVQYDAIKIDSANAIISSDIITLSNNNNVAYATLNSTSATFAQPVGFPVKTAAQWNAIAGSVGRQVCVSDSASGGNPNGMMAFWDTTHARWSYIHDNTAV